jgi:hypothetical protein
MLKSIIISLLICTVLFFSYYFRKYGLSITEIVKTDYSLKRLNLLLGIIDTLRWGAIVATISGVIASIFYCGFSNDRDASDEPHTTQPFQRNVWKCAKTHVNLCCGYCHYLDYILLIYHELLLLEPYSIWWWTWLFIEVLFEKDMKCQWHHIDRHWYPA